MAKRYIARLRPGVGGVPKGTIPWNKGKTVPRTPEWQESLSASLRGKPKSPEHRAKIGLSNLGKKMSDEAKAKLSASRKGLPGPNKGLRKSLHPLFFQGNSNPSGENHHAWKGGISADDVVFRNSSEYKGWRDAVFVRDQWTCQECGVVRKDIEAHHIKPFSEYPELRLVVKNGLTLCKSCHRKMHKKGEV